ncbi:MAG: class C sortase [Suipraeoptans sp.]
MNNLNMKKKEKTSVSVLVIIIIFLLGMLLLLYPAVSNYVAEINVSNKSTEYANTMTELSDEEIEEEWQKAIDYNNSLKGNPVKDPFVEGSGVALPSNYTSVLGFDDGVMGYISIPEINVYIPIRHGTSDEVLEEGAGHIFQTSFPVGGEGNHSVITAHTGYPRATLFNRLTELIEGDKFVIYILDKKATYEVDHIEVIEPDDIDQLVAVKGKDYITLVTCTPYGVNSHRLLVRGTRIPNEDDEGIPEYEAPFPWNIIVMVTVCLSLLIIFIIVVRKRYRRRISK